MYRFGLIGYGAMGNYHAQQIGTMPDFAVSAVYDIAPEKREKARAEGRDVCDSLEELLMRKDVDAVILAVPNNFHKPLAVAAMHAGKHVLCEKPVMMNSRDLLEVLAVSEQTGMLFTAGLGRPSARPAPASGGQPGPRGIRPSAQRQISRGGRQF